MPPPPTNHCGGPPAGVLQRQRAGAGPSHTTFTMGTGTPPVPTLLSPATAFGAPTPYPHAPRPRPRPGPRRGHGGCGHVSGRAMSGHVAEVCEWQREVSECGRVGVCLLRHVRSMCSAHDVDASPFWGVGVVSISIVPSSHEQRAALRERARSEYSEGVESLANWACN